MILASGAGEASGSLFSSKRGAWSMFGSSGEGGRHRSVRLRKVPLLAAAVSLALLGAATVVGGALAVTPDRTGTVTPTSPFTWQGATATGANSGYDAEGGEPCGKTPDTYCDVTLLNVNVAPSYWDAQGGGVQISLNNYTPNAASDFDLFVYKSDASGNRGELVGSSPNIAGRPESTTVTNASGYYIVQVVYFTVTASSYTGSAQFVAHSKYPPDIDSPAGLEDYLASNPSLGFRSHSEPHMAQNPLDRRMLVAGSKMYNRDPDSLKEYDFKIGTYVSFDGGFGWTDQGQLDVCPPSQAPPESWPDNTCYPKEDPTRDGTGEEDGTRGGGGDFGEEYITSDVWTQFDDEGNAYAMVLDSPPFESGNGWGMSFHRWESVSPQDLQAGGKTWGPKIVINHYSEGEQEALFLDDKNTFAVNNAGPNRDGITGTMLACWGQNIPDAIKQQIVCKRSTDAGKTWPGAPVPISGGEHLVIGVHVVADTQDPQTFYAFWLQYASGVAGAPDTLEYAKTIDGGLSWTAPIPITTLTGLPSHFPGQAFRNLSIPIAAVAPNGAVYAVYSDYRPAPVAGDADGLQADTMIVRSGDRGLTWSAPVKVNRDGGNADQFQPYVAVNPKGEVDVAYFDRRKDPDNFFIDLYLSRSSDGGQTFQDTRVSHDLWDPTINPPVSPSGDFVGDYQALVADSCNAIPFFNDTHLANSSARDPNFDVGDPRSAYQQVFAWRVPIGNCAPNADLALSKTDSPDPVHVGHDLTYTLRVANSGPSTATGVTLDDQLPKNAGFGSVTTNRGTCTLKPEKRIVSCDLGNLAPASAARVLIVVKPTEKGTIVNSASVHATSPGDPFSRNNTASAQTTVIP
jgi:uncharacterized repeat protein (TIGR01451 family)